MNSKYLAILVLIFGLLFALAQCGRLRTRDGDGDGDNGATDNGDNGATDNGDNGDGADNGDTNADLQDEKRAILNFLQNEDDASQFLDPSRRFLVGDQRSHMKDAKKGYEEKCERLFHPRYCPDLATWPAWNQAFNSATGKK